jgi:hypothetical protein
MSMRVSAGVVALVLLGLTSCARREDRLTFYVLASEAAAPSFPEKLASLARQQGLVANVGHATDDQGRTLYAVEAKGLRLRIWAQNMPLDPAPLCSHTAGMEVDPRYFIVEVEPTLSSFRGDSERVAGALQRGLGAAGYGIQASPAPCGSTDPGPRPAPISG